MDEGLRRQLKSLCSTWSDLLKFAKEDRAKKFGDDADCAMALLTGNDRLLWSDKFLLKGYKEVEGSNPGIAPEFRATLLKGAEVDQLFGPSLYHQDPGRQVNPCLPVQISPLMFGAQDPMAAQMMGQMLGQQFMSESDRIDSTSRVIEAYQNWSLREVNFKFQSRRVITEGLIKGMGVWWQELAQPILGVNTATVGSYYGSVGELLLDPDATQWEGVTWCARECIEPYYKVEQQYGLEPESLRRKGTLESRMSQCTDDEMRDWDRNQGGTNDLIRYYKVWSKCGIGDRLKNAEESVRGAFDSLGDNVYLVICPGVPYPLNLSPEFVDTAQDDDVFWALQWPIPFHLDQTHGWPFVPLGYHWLPDQVWPQSHLKPGFGELKWLHWAMSFLMNNVAEGAGSLIAYSSGIPQASKDAIRAVGRNRFIEIGLEDGKNIQDLVSFINHPNVRTDIWSMIAAVWDLFEKRTGLNELLYGMQTTQSRSAADVLTRNQNANIRIDDLAGATEEAVMRCGRNEAIAMRWLLTGQDVAPAVGQQGAAFWDHYIANSEIEAVVREYEYRIEAGSIRRPNQQAKIDQMNQAVQVFGPVLQQVAMAWGQVGPLNALMQDWCKANLVQSPERYLIQPPPPPPMMAPPGQPGPSGPPPQQQAA